MQKVGLRRLPLTRPLERDAPAVEQRPALRYAGSREAAHPFVIGLDRLGKALLGAQQIAELHGGASPARRLRRHSFELGDRLVGAIEHLEIGRDAQPRGP